MQNTLLTLIAVVVLVGGGYLLLMNTGGPVEPAAENTAMMDDTMAQNDTMDADMSDSMDETPAEPAQPNIVEAAVAADDFNTLVTAVTAAELEQVLAGEGPFTVFAPTDAAFAALPDGTLDTLLLPDSQADLTNILTYHVVAGEVTASDLSDGLTVEAVNGETLTFAVDASGGVMVNDANVMMADIETSNGIIHVIDTVLLPPME